MTRIYTRIVMDMTQDDLPVIECDSFIYDGPVSLCMGRDSDGSGGSANGGEVNAGVFFHCFDNFGAACALTDHHFQAFGYKRG